MKLKGKIVDINLDFLNHKPKITIELTNQEDICTDEFNMLQQEELIDVELKKHEETSTDSILKFLAERGAL